SDVVLRNDPSVNSTQDQKDPWSPVPTEIPDPFILADLINRGHQESDFQEDTPFVA
ncbi:unnamed protein product, partial [Protopolystoma xenopodis]